MQEGGSIDGCANVDRYASSPLSVVPRNGRRVRCASGARSAPGRDRLRAARRGGMGGRFARPAARRPAFRGHAPLPPAGPDVVRARTALFRARDDARLGLQPGRGHAVVRSRHPRGPRMRRLLVGARLGAGPEHQRGHGGEPQRPTSPPHSSARRRSRARRRRATAASSPRSPRAIPARPRRSTKMPTPPGCARSRAGFRATPRSRRLRPKPCSTSTRTTGGSPMEPQSHGPAT